MGILHDLRSLLRTKQEQTPEASLTNTDANAQKKILIVEDEAMLADALEIKFKQLGVTVLKAENGQIGLDLAQQQRPDVILLDLMMPIMDGKTMLRKLREIPEFKTVPVFVLTNAGDVDNLRETTTFYDAEDFIIKSNVDPEQIVARVQKKLFPIV